MLQMRQSEKEKLLSQLNVHITPTTRQSFILKGHNSKGEKKNTIEGFTRFTSSSHLISDNIYNINYVIKQVQKYLLLNVFPEL